jgi:hypothetical protein
LSCLANSSSVFPFISILSLISEILSSICSSLMEWPKTVFFISVWFFFSEVFYIMGYFLFHIFYFHL